MKEMNEADSSSLRKKAEERLKSKMSDAVSRLSEADTIKLVHEIEVQQIELELQQEEIMWAEEESERVIADNTQQSLLTALGKKEENERIKSEFLASICHEIRTPMNGILGFAGLLKEPSISAPERLEYISIIENSALKMLNIINDLVSLKKVHPIEQNEIVAAAVKTEKPVESLKILIAEDDEISAKLIARTVKLYSNEVLFAINGVEAVRLCRNHPDIELVLMDIKMPIMDGFEATREIRQFNNKVIIIAQTAFALPGDREKTITAGCNDYIAKPTNKIMLVGLLKKHFNILDK